MAVARVADVSVLFLGIDGTVEHESHDRTSIDLPDAQHALAKAVLALGKPTIIVLFNGGAVAVEEEMRSTNPHVAIIEAFYPVGSASVPSLSRARAPARTHSLSLSPIISLRHEL